MTIWGYAGIAYAVVGVFTAGLIKGRLEKFGGPSWRDRFVLDIIICASFGSVWPVVLVASCFDPPPDWLGR